ANGPLTSSDARGDQPAPLGENTLGREDAEVAHRLHEGPPEGAAIEAVSGDVQELALCPAPELLVLVERVNEVRECFRLLRDEVRSKGPEREPLGADRSRHERLTRGDRVQKLELDPRAETHRAHVDPRAGKPLRGVR